MKGNTIMAIKKVCVLGAGIMGAGIAQVAAQAGFDVVLRDIEDRFVENGMGTIIRNLDRAVAKGRMENAAAEQIMDRIEGVTDLKTAVTGADLVIEAIIEIMDLKKNRFQGTRRALQTRGHPGVKHLRALHYRDGRRHRPAGPGNRHAFFSTPYR